jgi:hypothetical protein
MADYKELIRKAIQALPENNGAARRAVYEKARAALVGQLRGLNPPLAARDITQHRLQLEDCIRQVEQEASEAVIAGLKQNEDLLVANPPPRAAPLAPRPQPAAPKPVVEVRPAPEPAPRAAAPVAAPRPDTTPRVAAVQSKPVAAPAAAHRPVAAAPRLAPRPVPKPASEPESIEDIIAAAEGADAEPIELPQQDPAENHFAESEPVDEAIEADEPESPTPEPPMFRIEPKAPRQAAPAPVRGDASGDSRPIPSIVARAEAAKSSGGPVRAFDSSRRPGGGDGSQAAAKASPRFEPAMRGQTAARQQVSEPIAMIGRTAGNAAMSSVREVEVERATEADPQVTIERAIATLEREARGDEGEVVNGVEAEVPEAVPFGLGRKRQPMESNFRDQPMAPETVFARAPVEAERGGGSAVTIFLLVFLLLLVGAGGAGLWAWREGYIDFDAMFGKAPAVSDQASKPQPSATTLDANDTSKPAPAPAANTGNTEAATTAAPQSADQLSAAPAQPTPLAPAPAPATNAASTPAPAATAPQAEPSAQTAGEAPKSEDRLTQTSTADATPATPDATKPAGSAAAAGGSQSLLLEAAQDGTTGAVPFSGTVEWSKGTDEMGQPTLVGKANIPARNLGVSVLIRRNTDPTLPASHLMEINFTVTDSFIGGAISGLPGVLLKNEELVQGTALAGASARVVGNSFLFALSASPSDIASNKDLLTSRKWMDLAIIYATGKKAIITLEKDDKAEQLFNDVFTAWAKETPVAAAPSPSASTTSK